MKIKLRHNTFMRLIVGSFLLIGFPGMCFLLVWLIWGVGIAMMSVLFLLLLVVYGFIFGWRRIVVRRAECFSPLLPKAFDGYRVLQLSDIHIGTFLQNQKFIHRLVDCVNAQKPDIIVFTGDLVNVSANEVIPFMKTLNKMHATDGIFSVMGNHDYCEYGEDKSVGNIIRNQNILQYMEEKIGWKLLNNQNVTISRGEGQGKSAIYLIGVENISRPPFPNYGDLKRAMEGLEKGTFKILLSHDPSHWRRGVLHQTDIALTLSGHTHAGQVKIGKFSPAKWAYNEWGGKYTEGGSMLYVSLGIGGTVPFRFGAWPEINVITLRRKES